MKLVIFGVSAASLVGGWFLLSPYTPPNVYPVAPDEAYQRLLKPVEIATGGGAYGSSPRYFASGNGKDAVDWASGMQGGAGCTILIAPFEGGRTLLNVTCPNAGEGAAAGLETGIRRNALIEAVDATMTGRTYDKDRARGATAGKWPEDTVDHGTIFDAQSQALEMHAEMMREQVKAEKTKPKPPGW